ARINANGGPYAGLDRYQARKRILGDLKNQGLLEKTQPYRHAVGGCQRCKTPIEPRLSVQWFCRMNDPRNSLARPAIDVVVQDVDFSQVVAFSELEVVGVVRGG
ncbi:class I tRNA ligase family protein, partial [Acidobacteriia bacterium AH_259_A11_L15]|nr:class I tRNA ligase family protein [Acidobacteriia bacterium AH_259_A11_L15]